MYLAGNCRVRPPMLVMYDNNNALAPVLMVLGIAYTAIP